MSEGSCPFCEILIARSREIHFETRCFFAITPLWPLSAGHILLIPKRHIPYFENLNEEEFSDLGKAIVETTRFLKDRRLLVEDYNIGINRGVTAGQTVFHLHLHVIPRIAGDVPDPRGGIIRNLHQQFQTTKRPPWLPEFPPQ